MTSPRSRSGKRRQRARTTTWRGLLASPSRLDEARRHVDRAIQANPPTRTHGPSSGCCRRGQGSTRRQKQSLQKALSLDAENYQATVNLTALYTRTRDPRRDEQAARLDALQKKRDERAQDFLRIIEFVPPSH